MNTSTNELAGKPGDQTELAPEFLERRPELLANEVRAFFRELR